MNYEDIRELLLPEIKATPVTAREFFGILGGEWKSIGESVNEVLTKVERRLDTDWIVEYLALHDTRERTANDS